MKEIKPHNYDPETWDDGETDSFERVRKQTDKALNPKESRRQQSKEWGKAINKTLKQRDRSGKP